VLRVVCDTNIYISAYNFGGLPKDILGLAQDGFLELYISAFILEEVKRVLKRFGWSRKEIKLALGNIIHFTTPVDTKWVSVDAVKDDPSDNYILECAIKARADVLVSGDNHLRKLREFRGIPIIAPRQFFEDRWMIRSSKKAA
jgi:putative PIN family toxin of toxin-antitoxin system